MKKYAFNIGVISQLLALCVFLYLANAHYQLKYGFVEGKSLCNISDYLNCDVVNLSEFSTFLGAPLALWGLWVNLTLLVVLLGWKFTQTTQYYKNLALVFSGITVFASLVMGFITLTLINAVCLFCLSAYVLSFITFFSVFSLQDNEKNAGFLKPLFDSKKWAWTGSFLLGPIAMTFLINSMVMSQMALGIDQVIATSIQEWKNNPTVDLSSAKGLTKGADPSKAKIVIVEFADFQCIHCRHAYPVLANFVRTRSDVSIIFQSFPLDANCNPAEGMHKGDGLSCELAKAVYCGWQQKKGWELHDWVYDNFGHVEISQLMEYAESIGINIQQFRECRDSISTQDSIISQAQLGMRVNVRGTPTIYVNGHLLPRGNFLPVLEAAYKELK